MKTRSFRSFAKINLGLEVTGRLPNGYHELKTLFATLSLHDTIDIKAAGRGVSVRSDDERVPEDETNLAYRAAVAMQRLARRKGGVEIHIHKRIAVGGGLGGGSSNAATVLRALDLIWGLDLGAAGLLETAKSLGADVPYFLFGGPALGLGRGDLIQPLTFALTSKVLLVPGSHGVSTAAVFRRFAALGGPTPSPSRVDAFLSSPQPARLGRLRNDLESAAIEENSSLATTAYTIRRVGRATGALQAAMSGSGSSFFLVFGDSPARAAAKAALQKAGIAAVSCSFVSRRSYAGRFEVRAP